MRVDLHLSSQWSYVVYEPRKLHRAPHRLLLIFVLSCSAYITVTVELSGHKDFDSAILLTQNTTVTSRQHFTH